MVRPVGIAAMLTIMSVSTIIIAVILCLPPYFFNKCYHANQTKAVATVTVLTDICQMIDEHILPVL
jgi:hypothetical protein